jgi:hypothetical protein
VCVCVCVYGLRESTDTLDEPFERKEIKTKIIKTFRGVGEFGACETFSPFMMRLAACFRETTINDY